MTDSEDCIDNADHKILSYEHQVTKINNRVSKECDLKEDDSYLKMFRGDDPHMNMYPYNSSCICVGCGRMFQSPNQLMEHWDHSPKCNDKQMCGTCKANGLTNPKLCKHFTQELPRVMIVDASNVLNYDQAVQTESNQNDFNSMNTNNYSVPNPAMKRYNKNSRIDDEKTICPLPPPPQNDPLKPLPYRIDFLLNSGVIKHARMNINGKSNNSLYFEKKRPRKPRTHFTDSQIEDLEKVFADKKYLSATERQIIATDLSLVEEQVKNWFQNRRSRWRKECRDSIAPMQHTIKMLHQSRPNEQGVVMGNHTDSTQNIAFEQDHTPILFDQDSKPILSLQT